MASTWGYEVDGGGWIDQALSDRAYREQRDRYTGPAGISWLHRWALTRGISGAVLSGEPELPQFVRELAKD